MRTRTANLSEMPSVFSSRSYGDDQGVLQRAVSLGDLPVGFGDDGLPMQKLLVEPRFDELKIYSERGKRVCERVVPDWERSQEG